MGTFDKAILVAGNGQSRKIIDLFQVSLPVIGCNALHRDYIPNYLVCCDRRMIEEATANPQMKNSIIFVRHLWYNYFRKIKKNKNIRLLPDLPYHDTKKQDHPDHWGSGPYALLVAAEMSYEYIYMIGFDLYSQNQTVNNIYKGTVNYSEENSPPVNPSFWIHQIGKIIQIYKNKKFIIFNADTWSIPTNWNNNNVICRNIQQFSVDIK